jgi:hypothetical protein
MAAHSSCDLNRTIKSVIVLSNTFRNPLSSAKVVTRVGQKRIQRCIYGNFCRDLNKLTVIYGINNRLRPTLVVMNEGA